MVFLFQNCGQFDGQGNPVATESSDSQVLQTASSASSENEVAVSLYRRLAGVTLPIDDPIIKQIEARIAEEDAQGAAEIAVSSPNFLNITVRDFATKMSNRDQSVAGDLNDFVATVMGSVRDDIPATTMMTGNFFYRAEGQEGVAENLVDDIVTSNNHYRDLQENVTDIASVLVKVDGQQVMGEGDQVQNLRDPAGLMTTRGWMSAHANAGTNRRLIEYAFKIFACTPIESWASTSRSTAFVGRDVTRINLDDDGQQVTTEFDNKCASCHAGMDAVRPATAFFDYEETDAASGEGFIKYGYQFPMDPDPNNANNLNQPVPAAEQSVPSKFRRALETPPVGFAVTDDRWTNLATEGQFGFRLSNQGSGMGDFSRLIATSRQFSRCMVQRVFQTVCRQEVQTEDSETVEALTESFERDNHNLKNLFVKVAVNPSCMGLGN